MPGWEDTVFPVGLIRSGNSTTERPSQHGCCRGTSSGHGLFDSARWERGDGSLLAGRFRTWAWCAADLLRAKSSTLVELPSPRSRFCLIRGGALLTSCGRNLQRSSSSRHPAPVLSHWWGCAADLVRASSSTLAELTSAPRKPNHARGEEHSCTTPPRSRFVSLVGVRVCPGCRAADRHVRRTAAIWQ